MFLVPKKPFFMSPDKSVEKAPYGFVTGLRAFRLVIMFEQIHRSGRLKRNKKCPVVSFAFVVRTIKFNKI